MQHVYSMFLSCFNTTSSMFQHINERFYIEAWMFKFKSLSVGAWGVFWTIRQFRSRRFLRDLIIDFKENCKWSDRKDAAYNMKSNFECKGIEDFIYLQEWGLYSVTSLATVFLHFCCVNWTVFCLCLFSNIKKLLFIFFLNS